jgi:hypothetical protein
MDNTQVIGYRVRLPNGTFVNSDGRVSFEQEPCTQAAAYRRVADFLSLNLNASAPEIVPVTRILTPIETASRELGDQLQSLLRRHGLDLGLSREQIERRIAQELAEFGAIGASAVGMLRR